MLPVYQIGQNSFYTFNTQEFTLIKALACGIPVVVSNIPGIYGLASKYTGGIDSARYCYSVGCNLKIKYTSGVQMKHLAPKIQKYIK
jgi:hypothetical protein